jgi:hypothetical protein
MPKCEQCHQPYLPYHTKQRFCSAYCRNHWHQQKYREVRDWWREMQAQFEDEQKEEARVG